MNIPWLDSETHGFDTLASDQRHSTAKVLCPICLYDYNHLDGHRNAQGRESGGDRSELETRGDGVILSAWCENGHAYEIVFAFHKGNLYMAVRSNGVHEEYALFDIAPIPYGA